MLQKSLDESPGVRAVPGAACSGWAGAPGNDDLTANPIEFITHFTGDWTIRLIVITLAVTPLRKLLGLPDLIRFRRMIGLFAFFYGCLHFTDLRRGWTSSSTCTRSSKDVGKRPFITAGFTAFLLHGAAGADLHQGLDPAAGRQALADAAPAGLRQRRSRAWCITTGW